MFRIVLTLLQTDEKLWHRVSLPNYSDGLHAARSEAGINRYSTQLVPVLVMGLMGLTQIPVALNSLCRIDCTRYRCGRYNSLLTSLRPG